MIGGASMNARVGGLVMTVPLRAARCRHRPAAPPRRWPAHAFPEAHCEPVLEHQVAAGPVRPALIALSRRVSWALMISDGSCGRSRGFFTKAEDVHGDLPGWQPRRPRVSALVSIFRQKCRSTALKRKIWVVGETVLSASILNPGNNRADSRPVMDFSIAPHVM
jgi:hypothetical protein